MKAVIQFQNKQYLVEADQEVVVDRTEDKVGDTIEISDVLLITDNQTTHVGTPNVKGARVIAQVLEHDKGDKIRVATYKAKSRYRRVKGFRPHLTRLKIKSINLK